MMCSVGWTDYAQNGEDASLDVRIRGSREDIDSLFSAIARVDRLRMLQGADGRIVLVPMDAAGRRRIRPEPIEGSDREHDEKEAEERPRKSLYQGSLRWIRADSRP